MRDKKRVLKITSQVEYKSLESYFENMAAKGWLIDNIGVGMTFKRIEPRKLKFNVAIISPKTMLDWPDKETTSTFDEFCESAGWQLTATNQVYRVYYRPAEIDGPPIYTEEEDVYRAVRSLFFKSDIFMIFLPLLYFVTFWMNMSHKQFDMFASNISIFNLGLPFSMTIMFWMISMPTLYWVLVNKKRLNEGEKLFFFSAGWVKNKNRLLVGFMTLYFILLLFALLFDPYNNYGPGFLVMAVVPVTVLFGIMYLYNRYVKKATYPLAVKIVILVAVWFVSMGLIIGGMITFIGFDVSGSEREEPVAPEVNRLTLEELGFEGPSELDWWHVNSSVLVPLSYEFHEELLIEGNEAFLRVEHLRNRTLGLAEWSFNTALERERENYLEWLAYRPEYANYIIEITPDNPYNAIVYSLSGNNSEILILKDYEVYKLWSSEVFEGETLERALKGLFEE